LRLNTVKLITLTRARGNNIIITRGNSMAIFKSLKAIFKYLIAIFLIIVIYRVAYITTMKKVKVNLFPDAMAEWTLIEEADNYDLYADKATIRKNGNIATMWTLDDYESPQKLNAGTYLSSVYYREYDCVEEKLNTLSVKAYSKNMRQGEVITTFSLDTKDWDYISPGSMGEAAWKIACGK
jgi:hypothetical protein